MTRIQNQFLVHYQVEFLVDRLVVTNIIFMAGMILFYIRFTFTGDDE